MPPREDPLDTRDQSPKHEASTADLRPLTSSSLLAWKTIHRLLQGEDCTIDGSSLDIASVVAVAKSVPYFNLSRPRLSNLVFRYGTSAKLSTDDVVTKRIHGSVRMLRTHLDQGHVVYGKSYRCLDP